MLAAPKRQVQHQATAGRAVLRNARRDSYGFTKGSERIWRAQELLENKGSLGFVTTQAVEGASMRNYNFSSS